ncbi:hypothetical protein lerEdw1_006746, partial [Lerista edwardsae]
KGAVLFSPPADQTKDQTGFLRGDSRDCNPPGLACAANHAPLGMEKGEISDPPVNEAKQLKELEEWEDKVAQAEKEKANMLLLKLAADKNRRDIEEKLAKLKELENQMAVERMATQKEHQRQLSEIEEHNSKLSSDVQRLKDQLAEKKLKSEELRRTLRLRKAIPEMKVKFTRLENSMGKEAGGNVCGCFHISSEVPMKLNQGEALITFEEENVAQELIRKQEHCVNLENGKMTVLKAQPVVLGMGVSFKLHAQTSLQRVVVFNIPNLHIPEEWMQDKLELHFLKLSGGEVQSVSYDRHSQTALITFARPQAAKDLARYNECPFHAGGQAHRLQVTPSPWGMVEGFQMFSGTSRRTILLTGIADVEEDEECVQDLIAIHFQKPSHGGGEVEHIKYVSQGTKAAYFEIGHVMTC